jgi:hypothetical protein
MNSFHVVCWRRFGAGAIPKRRKCCGRDSSVLRQCGRIPNCCYLVPSGQPARLSSTNCGSSRAGAVFGTIELAAISLRYQAKMLSGCATEATYSSARRPIRLAISAKVTRCALLKGTRAGKWERRILFSAIRYSFCRKSCWFTKPVTYANNRATCVFFIETHHHKRLCLSALEYFD